MREGGAISGWRAASARAAATAGGRAGGSERQGQPVRLRETLLPPDLVAASAARRFLREALGEIPREALDTVLLLTSEVVGNAVRHGSGSVRLRAEVLSAGQPLVVRVRVDDDSGEPPRRQPPALDERGLPPESGRGVLLLDELASRWGVVPEPPGKQVWFELDLPA